MLEIEDVAQVGAAPFVDGLIRIADDRQVPVDLGEPPDEEVLRPVRVLVLVDHDVLELVRILGAHLFGLLEQLDGPEQQIVEIERVRIGEHREIPFVDLGDLLVPQAPAGGAHLGRAFHPVLGRADPRQRETRREVLVVDPEVLQRPLDDRVLVGGVVDHEITREADVRTLPPEQPRAERVKGGDPDLLRLLADQPRDALAHLVGRLVREGDGKDVARLGEPVADQVRDAVGDRACLPGPGARENEQRALGMEHGFALGVVECVEEVHGAGAALSRDGSKGRRSV